MNVCVIVGRLVSDGRYAKRNFNGTEAAVYNNTVAVNKKLRNGTEKTEFFDFAAWRGLGDVCKQYCRKGMMVAVSGEAGLNTFQSANGAWNARLKLDNVNQVQFCDHYGQPVEAEEADVAPEEVPANAPGDFVIAGEDDELPF